MDYIKRKIDFEVRIVRPNYNSSTYIETDIVKFISSERVIDSKQFKSSTAMVSYNFGESLASVDSTFALMLTLEEDNVGQTWYDKILEMDLVFISEFGESRFAGYVRSRRYVAKVGSDGKPERRISINGGSLGNLLSSFKLVIDQYLYQGSELAEDAAKQLKEALTQKMGVGQQIAPLFIQIYKSFFALVLKMGETNPSGTGIKTILDNFIDYDSKMSKTLLIQYPLVLSLYQIGENNIWEIWSQMVHPPIGELFGLWNFSTEKYEIVFRQSPFDPDDWKGLTINNIPSIIVTDFDIGTSIDEVFTFYYVTLPGSPYSRNEALGLAVEGYGFTPAMDKEKWKKYGYKSLMIELRYFNKGELETFTGEGGVGSVIARLSKKLQTWYTNNDEFLSGKIEIMTIDNRAWDGKLKNPRIGEKIGFIEGEFYLESTTHAWNYGGPMTTTLDVSRGYNYTAFGNMIGKINNVGSKARTITSKIDKR